MNTCRAIGRRGLLYNLDAPTTYTLGNHAFFKGRHRSASDVARVGCALTLGRTSILPIQKCPSTITAWDSQPKYNVLQSAQPYVSFYPGYSDGLISRSAQTFLSRTCDTVRQDASSTSQRVWVPILHRTYTIVACFPLMYMQQPHYSKTLPNGRSAAL